MSRYLFLNLHMFEGDGAGAAPGGAGDGAGQAAEIAPGVLDDGTQVDSRLAARMKRQEERRAARGKTPQYKAPTKAATGQAEAEQGSAEGESPAKGPDDRWNELIKGEFKEQYGKSVQDAIQNRFKNQQDLSEKLAALQPALDLLAKQRGLQEGDNDALVKAILADDSLLEEQAEQAGMTVETYRTMQQLEQENERFRRAEEENERNAAARAHYAKLAEQAEALKQRIPDFDLQKELFNPNDNRFLRMTSPEGGLDVETAYFAIHHRELEPQAMAYGIRRGMDQMAQTLQANQRRPVEGAIQGGQAGNFQVDPRTMTKAQRQELIQRAKRGEKITL